MRGTVKATLLAMSLLAMQLLQTQTPTPIQIDPVLTPTPTVAPSPTPTATPFDPLDRSGGTYVQSYWRWTVSWDPESWRPSGRGEIEESLTLVRPRPTTATPTVEGTASATEEPAETPTQAEDQGRDPSSLTIYSELIAGIQYPADPETCVFSYETSIEARSRIEVANDPNGAPLVGSFSDRRAWFIYQDDIDIKYVECNLSMSGILVTFSVGTTNLENFSKAIPDFQSITSTLSYAEPTPCSSVEHGEIREIIVDRAEARDQTGAWLQVYVQRGDVVFIDLDGDEYPDDGSYVPVVVSRPSDFEPGGTVYLPPEALGRMGCS